MTRPKAKDDYHHGDLRGALVAAALTRVRQDGAERLSLREAARELGVTSGAMYKHFADKDALLAAVAVEALELLALRVARATKGLSGAERLLATGRAYIAFASAEPLLFRLAFSRYGALTDTGLCTAFGDTPNAYMQLRDAVADVMGCAAEAVEVDQLALAWSVAHGAASLICDGMWSPRDPRAEAALRQAFVQITASPRGPRKA